MGDEPITPQVRAFIAAHVESVMALEALLLVAADPGRRWNGAALAQQLRIDATWAAAQLRAFADHGLLASDAAGGEFWYEPRSPELSRTVSELARAYAERRVSVISLVFEKPVDQVRSFADAFRIRKEKSDG